MINNILALCSRDRGHEAVYSLLRSSLVQFDALQGSWEDLIFEAEKQGLSPLLYKHLMASEHNVPASARRLLQTLYLRNKRSNDIRNKTVAEILTALQEKNVPAILLKGIALSNWVYEDYATRPMRDIDILIDKRDVFIFLELLFNLGFCQETNEEIGEDHHHLEPLVKIIDGLSISIEVHRQLLPEQLNDSKWSFENLSKKLETISVCGIKGQTLIHEHSLHYLYLHGLRAPLMYAPFRLIHVADLVSFVELNYKKIDWEVLEESFPTVVDILSRLHFLTPWHPDVLENMSFNISRRPASPGIPFCGWPLHSPRNVPSYGLPKFCKDTIWPPQWWMQVYYGKIKMIEYYKVRLIEHPREIWRLFKTYLVTRKSQ